METLEIVVLLSAAAVGFLGIGVTVLAWRGSPMVPVLLYEMLRRQGGEAARIALASGDRSFGLAIKNCIDCQAKARCRAWLDSGSRDGYDAFCGNSGYVTRMRNLAAQP